jgi:hypothetical protein
MLRLRNRAFRSNRRSEARTGNLADDRRPVRIPRNHFWVFNIQVVSPGALRRHRNVLSYQSRSQDLPEALHDVGQFYWGRPSAWIDKLPIYSLRSTVLRIPRSRACDIDTEEDWRAAEAMVPYLMGADLCRA